MCASFTHNSIYYPLKMIGFNLSGMKAVVDARSDDFGRDQGMVNELQNKIK